MSTLQELQQRSAIAWKRAFELLDTFPASLSDSAAVPKTMREIWLPDEGKPVVLLRWLFSEWCNYRCPYCPQTHDRHAPKGDKMTAHAFDNYPLQMWLDAFDRHFADVRLSMVMTGGESMLDRKNMTVLLNYLSKKDNVECIRIDTNAWWRVDQFPDLEKSKLILMCTFHPSQVKEKDFVGRIQSYVDNGFNVGIVNYVMDEVNIDQYAAWREKFTEKGLILHPNPLWGSNGNYKAEDLIIMESALPELDFKYRSGASNPYQKNCYFPALSYEMDLTGNIQVGCQPELKGSFFDDELPKRPSDKIPCPFHTCVCLDKYSFLEGSERNVSSNPLADYARVLRAHASSS